jgi:hypothetical protein
VQTAIRLAKRMIVDGRMPAPEEALEQLRRRQSCLDGPFVAEEAPEPEPVLVTVRRER